jgi:hypothetical protein
MAVAQMAGGRPEPGADLEDVALEVGAEQRRDVVLPVLRPREELELLPGVRLRVGWAGQG